VVLLSGAGTIDRTFSGRASYSMYYVQPKTGINGEARHSSGHRVASQAHPLETKINSGRKKKPVRRGTDRPQLSISDAVWLQLRIKYFTAYNVLFSLVYCNTHGWISHSTYKNEVASVILNSCILIT
jgi:hypothetical protein